jgi:hypothetical protein
VGIDAQVGVAAEIQYDGTILELTNVRVGAEKARCCRRGFGALSRAGVADLAYWHADLHGISLESRFAAKAANRRLLKDLAPSRNGTDNAHHQY